jgi:hypothetical protein
MEPLVILGIFMLGAGSGGLCVLLHQRGCRSKLQEKLEDQLDKALFNPGRRHRGQHQ